MDADIDLDNVVPGPQSAPSFQRLVVGQIGSDAYDPARDRENIRGNIAMRLVWTLVALVGGSFLLAAASIALCSGTACNASTASLEPVKAVVQLLLTPVVGLVGAVTGFYFGEQSGRNSTI